MQPDRARVASSPPPAATSDPRTFTKATSQHTRAEARALRLVEGPGIVPLHGADDQLLHLEAARCTIADVIADRGRLRAVEVRGVAVAAGLALARCHGLGVVHGDVKPANLLLSDHGDLWLADFDTAGPIASPRTGHTPGHDAGPTLTIADDVRALAATAVECAVGSPIDLATAWSALQLSALGCPADLAAEIALILRRPTSASALVQLLDRDDATLPRSSAPNQADRTPTVKFELLG